MKKKINVFDYAGDIMKALDKGVLITTKADGKVDSMTLGWGTLGIDWSLPVFTAYIRKSRFTKEQLEKNPEFTVNGPYGAFDPKILGVCGSKSGRDMDKAKELGLTLVDPEVISVPAVKELPLTLECRVVCVEKQDTDTMPEEILKEHYPSEKPTPFGGSLENYHYAFYGQIVSAYMIED